MSSGAGENDKQYQNVWKLFVRSNDIATCNKCNKEISCKGSSTTGLHRHLERKHAMQKAAPEENSNLKRFKHSSSSSNHNLTKYFPRTKRETLEEIVAKLAAFDNIPIQKICNCEFIRTSLKLQGFDLPKHPTDVMNLIYKYYEKKKESLRSKITAIKSANQKIAQSIDEWTSLRNKRYLNIHIYFENGESENLGLVRLHGSCPADKMVNLVNQKLESFHIHFEKDVIATTSDGASVMVKFGELSEPILQLCYNHGIHLAVINIFYKKTAQITMSSSSESDEGRSDSDFNDNQFGIFSEEEFESSSTIQENVSMDESPNIKSTIAKIRTIVKKFKNSPVRNSTLQKYVKEAENSELHLLLDCKTRWNSLITMIERFLRLIGPIQKALVDLNLDYLWRSEYIKEAANILAALKPVEIAVEALSRHDANLLTSEGILKFLFDSLEENDSLLTKTLLEEIKTQISKRRNVSLISLLKFLNNPNCYSHCGSSTRSSSTDYFKLVPKNELVKTAKSLIKKIIAVDDEEQEAATPNEIEMVNNENENTSKSLKERLEASIHTSLATNAIKNDMTTVLKEINLYEITGQITPNLKLLKNALFAIRPTSTQNERNFSTSSHLVTKKRTRLSDRAVDALCFLKFYFMK